MENYKVIVTQMVEDDILDLDDLNLRPSGEYFYKAISEEEALDMFNWDVAISVLDDFEIKVERIPSNLEKFIKGQTHV